MATVTTSGICEICGDAAHEDYGYICADCIREVRESRIVSRGGVWCDRCDATGVYYTPDNARHYCTCAHGKDAERNEREIDEAEAREYRRLARMGII